VSPRRPSPAGSIPKTVVIYTAQGCHLCERARGQLDRLGVAYDAVDITGDHELEARYREWLPVVEIDGERAFVYYIDEAALLRKLAQPR
jgi:glutaredoxin